MDTSCLNVKILEADGTCQREKGFMNPPKAATEILDRLQAGGRVGTLRNSRGRSLSGSGSCTLSRWPISPVSQCLLHSWMVNQPSP